MYKYEDHKHTVFLEKNQRRFLEARDRVRELLTNGKYFDMTQAIAGLGGDSWENMALIDRLLELGEIYEVETKNSNRIFTKRDWS